MNSNTLKTFQKNKTPGNDGLTVEFYLVFWPIVGKHLTDCFNYVHDPGKLSNSQKQVVITLLEKKGKDKRLIKNWRPISLINVDAKIASKTLAKHLELILPELIQCSQNAYVKGRSIFDAVLMIFWNTPDIRKCQAFLLLLTLKKRLTLWTILIFLKFSVHSILGHLSFNGYVLCIQIYQVVLSTMVLHQMILQLVEVCGKEIHSHLFFSY